MKNVTKFVEILEEIKAKDIKAYDYEKKSPFFDHVIIATTNSRQANAAITHLKRKNLLNAEKVEGRNTGWTLIDGGDIIIHLFDEENRKHYNFDERLMSIKQII